MFFAISVTQAALHSCMATEIFEVVSQLVMIFSIFLINFAGAMNGGGYG